ncbi:SDR family oxidoreductase [Magnetospira sp. QH-2]|uniref:SDR family oxidoreductase n=1 Tax=Magnetospira sp. (strain QH-2) TaxID=1288970 RepID=UPI0003E8191D|nr:SDR family oxidoreductase [Magnetospira sp. QH-2]CCQ74556.1 putative oxidoreductase (YgfF), NAD(P)-binding domain [Magnetospira sp. QH-2]
MTRNILITGGSRGIGRASAILCGARGWHVGINYRDNESAATATASLVKEAGGQAVLLKGDVSDEQDVLALFDAMENAFGPISGLVNNAGIVAPLMPLAEMSVARLRHMFEVNILGAYLCAREAARRLADGGAIVNLSSIAAKLGSPNEFVDYAGSKGAMDSLTVGLAKELAPRRIRVNAVRPGLIETEIHADSGWAERARDLAAAMPLGRPGTAEEVAEAIVWLLDDGSSYVTGTLLDVAGGR